MYTVSMGSHTTDIQTRAEAIASAKELSAENRQTVYVRDESERERFTYPGGELESYTYDTQPRRRERSDRDRDRDRSDRPSQQKPAEGDADAKPDAKPAAEAAATAAPAEA